MSSYFYGKVVAMIGSGSVMVGETGRIVASDGNVEAMNFVGGGGECTDRSPTSAGRCVSDTTRRRRQLRASRS